MKSNNQNKIQSLTLNDIVLMAALELCDGDTSKRFTAEELLVKSWKINSRAFGLRGFEQDYPDSNILYTKFGLESKMAKIHKQILSLLSEKPMTLAEISETLEKKEKQVFNALKKLFSD